MHADSGLSRHFIRHLRIANDRMGERDLVGTGRFELPTCRLGGDRSIHLSYVPAYPILPAL